MEKPDLSIYDFNEDDGDGPRPQLMNKIRRSFAIGDRSRKRRNPKIDDEWVPSSVRKSGNASSNSIGSRTRGRKGVLPVVVLEENRKSLAQRRKQEEEEEKEEEEEEQQLLLQEAVSMSRLCTLVFPPDDSDPVTITESDIDRLRPSAFLNDTIIDFYIKYLQTKLSESKKRMTYFFNSFFFQKLVDLSTLPADEAKMAFARLEKWTNKVDMFEKDFIIIPVNRSSHWSLLIICYLSDMVPRNLDRDLHSSSTCVLHFDSYDGFHSDIEPFIRNYLRQEWDRRKTDEHQQLQYQFDQIKFVKAKVPQQDNPHDCGLFLLHYVELFLERAFSSRRGQLSFIKKDWFDPAAASAKRSQLLRLIHEMYLENLESQGQSSSGNLSRNFSSEPSSSQRQRSSQKSSGTTTTTRTCVDDDEELVMLHGSLP